jgi:RimJ/RimL family protein N-acetyltransferase
MTEIVRELDWQPAPRPARDLFLRGSHVLLRPVEAADAEALHAETSDPSLWRYMSAGPYADLAEVRAALLEMEASVDPQFLTVVRLPDERPVGTGAYMRIEPEHGVIEIGSLMFGASLQRTIAATEAIYLLARHAFEDLGYRRLEWKCDALNEPSRRAAARYGFRFEGIFRQHMVVKGRNRDTAWFAILDHEWPGVAAGFRAWLDPSNHDPAGVQRRPLGELIELARGSA